MPALLVLDDLDGSCPAASPEAAEDAADSSFVAWLCDLLDSLSPAGRLPSLGRETSPATSLHDGELTIAYCCPPGGSQCAAQHVHAFAAMADYHWSRVFCSGQAEHDKIASAACRRLALELESLRITV